MSDKLHFIILRNELSDDHYLWEKACLEFKDILSYSIVDLTKYDWLEKIQEKPADALLAKPGGINGMFKQLYDERIYVLERVLGYKIFPSAEEIFIYENKRFLAAWLKANMIPHPATYVFYNQGEALNFLSGKSFPIVAKTNIGASGSGVRILKSSKEAVEYTKNTFLGKGASQRIGPNLEKGGLLKRAFYYVLNPSKIGKKLAIYQSRKLGIQKGVVIFQHYIPHDFEWRVVRIGHSFFAHKKLLKYKKASGSLLKRYDNPPMGLFDFVKDITDKHRLFSQAVDLFETPAGYMVNEMQCIFGQSDPFQMKVDGKIGRYIHFNGNWVFEEGDFNQIESYVLRVKFLLESFNYKN